MTDLSIENLLPRANYSVYKLVSMASARALELSDGKRCLVDHPPSGKLTTMALEEIAQGKIESKEAADLRKPSDGNQEK
jgi:DNA-directed RNA polymerase omega subunit